MNTDLIRDHVDSFILRFLAKGDSYGYDIHKAISIATDGVYEIKQPTLYSCLKRLEKQGFITSYDGETSNGAQRKYYSITDKGRDFLNKDLEQWEFSRTLLDRLLSDKQIDLATVPRPFDPSELRPRTKRGSGVAAVAEGSEATTEQLVEETISPVADSAHQEAVDTAAHSQEVVSSALPTADAEPQQSVAAEEQQTPPSEGDPSSSISFDPVDATQLDIDSYVAEEESQQPSPVLQDFLRQHVAENDDYLSPLSAMFDVPVATHAPVVEQEKEEQPEDSASHNTANYGELKEQVQNQGYRLHPYSRSVSTSYYSMNFIYSARLRRDSLLLLYLVMFIEVLVAYFALDHIASLGYVFYIVVACILLVFPIAGIVFYLIKPDKRIRAEFDLKASLSGMIMLTINLFIVSMLFAFFLFHADLGAPKTMVKPILYPTFLFIDLPIYSLIYAALYNTHRYHLK